ncbi:MAG: LPS assembly lipoprotein LptE [Bosea sp. (in: a-proteobacteria)]
MSSSEQTGPSRRLALAIAGLAALSVGGCFRPLYGEGTVSVTGGSVRSALAGIEVASIPDRLGHYLRNELVFDLDGSGQESEKRLLLTVKVTEALDIVSVDYSTGRADSATLVATAIWTLSNKSTGQAVTNGTSIARASYDRSSQRFATVRAARDAQIRAARSLSELIRNRIATALVAGG